MATLWQVGRGLSRQASFTEARVVEIGLAGHQGELCLVS